MNYNHDEIHQSRQSPRPDNVIVSTKTIIVTYDETDEEELISAAQAHQKAGWST
jgi:hypothetical protein